MSLELFIASLALTLGTVGAALLYLRGITRRVLVASNVWRALPDAAGGAAPTAKGAP